MLPRKLTSIVLLLTGLLWCLPGWSNAVDSRYQIDDFIVLLDNSKSMKERIPGIEGDYFIDPMKAVKSRNAMLAVIDLVENVLRENDSFTLIRFGNKPELIESQVVRHPHERRLMVDRIRRAFQFNDKNTDLVAAIELAGAMVTEIRNPGQRKIVLLITDATADPPRGSVWAEPEAQQQLFEGLRPRIDKERWGIALVGLDSGEATLAQIDKLGNSLGLRAENKIAIGTGEDIAARLKEIIENIRGQVIDIEQPVIEGSIEEAAGAVETQGFRLSGVIRPEWSGGYQQSEIELKLNSTFPYPVEIQFRTRDGIVFQGVEAGFNARILTPKLTLMEGQDARVALRIGYSGERPLDGQLNGTYEFRFSEGSERFFPYTGTIKVTILSWWEVYGIWFVAIVVLLFSILVVALLVHRKKSVPELSVQLYRDSRTLGEPYTLHKKQALKISNDDFAGPSVPADGLAGNVTVTLVYLGRRRFQVTTANVELVVNGKTLTKAVIGLDAPFDLRDENGKTLRNITVSAADVAAQDPFGRMAGDSDELFA